MRTDYTLEDIRTLVPSWTAQNIAVTPMDGLINRIVMVGALLSETTSVSFRNALDEELLTDTMDMLSAQSVGIGPNLHLKHINKDPSQGGLDFADHQQPVDVLALANLYWPDRYESSADPDYYISPRFQKLSDIVDKAQELDVKYVFTKSCGWSVPVRAFQDFGPYKVMADDDSRSTGVVGATGFAVREDVIPSLRAGAYTAGL